MSETPVRYRSPEEDSGRWAGFPYRLGDIVISTRSKSGTTWVQMICALLIFQTPDLPAPLSQLSRWLDWLVTPRDELFAQLDAQHHRRFIKTHTPLDGVPLDPQVTYIVVGRHPLDMAVSLYHQGANIDHDRLRQLSGGPEPPEAPGPRPPLHTWLLSWIEQDHNPREKLDSLCGVIWHFSDAWQRRDWGNVVLVHFDDLREDLEGEMRRLAGRLQIDVPEATWPQLIQAARFDTMKARANQLAPDHAGILKSRQAFFRSGKSGAGQAVLSPPELDRYRERTAGMAPSELLAWLHRDRSPTTRESARQKGSRLVVIIWYHMITMARAQTLVQLTDRLLAALDQYAARVGRNRSEVIRSAIEHYLEESLEDDIDRVLVEGYTKQPQEPDHYIDAVARDSIAAEPW